MKDFIRLIVVTLVILAAYYVYSTFFVEETPDMSKPSIQLVDDSLSQEEQQTQMDLSGLSAVDNDAE